MNTHNILPRQHHSCTMTHGNTADAEPSNCFSCKSVQNLWQLLCPRIKFQMMNLDSIIDSTCDSEEGDDATTSFCICLLYTSDAADE